MTCINGKFNIFHRCKHKFMNYTSTQIAVFKHKITERRLGALPFDFFQHIEKSEYSNVTREIDKLFTDYSREIFKTVNNKDLNEKLALNLQRVLKRNDITVEMAGLGHFKLCQKLTIGKFQYALLSFFENFDNKITPTHGKYVEPQTIHYVYKNFHGRVARPFMTRMCTDRTEYGYMLNQFIDPSNKARAKGPLNPLKLHFREIRCRDAHYNGNTINGVLCDVGGIERNDSYIKDNVFRENLGRFLDRIRSDYLEMQRFYREPLAKYSVSKEEYEATINAERFLSDLMDKDIDIYAADLREVLSPLSADEQKIAIRMVRRMRNAHNFKNELKAKGEYEQYRELLNDFTYYCPEILIKELELVSSKTIS